MDHSGVMLASFQDHFGETLESCLDHLLESLKNNLVIIFWNHFERILESS